MIDIQKPSFSENAALNENHYRDITNYLIRLCNSDVHSIDTLIVNNLLELETKHSTSNLKFHAFLLHELKKKESFLFTDFLNPILLANPQMTLEDLKRYSVDYQNIARIIRIVKNRLNVTNCETEPNLSVRQWALYCYILQETENMERFENMEGGKMRSIERFCTEKARCSKNTFYNHYNNINSCYNDSDITAVLPLLEKNATAQAKAYEMKFKLNESF